MAQDLASSFPMEELDYDDFLGELGSGARSKVMLAKDFMTNTKVAIKKAEKTSSALIRFRREVQYLRALRHPNILKLIRVFEDEKQMCLETEYASGRDLGRLLGKQQRLSERDARPLFRQLLAAVQHCHKNQVVHRNLKPANILLDGKHDKVILAGFSLAETFTEEGYLNRFCGTPAFSAPEMFLRQKYVGPEVDVWSLGVVIYNMVAGHVPFMGDNWEQMKKNIIGGIYETPDFFSDELRELVRKCLTIGGKLRPTVAELMEDAWMQMQDPIINHPVMTKPHYRPINLHDSSACYYPTLESEQRGDSSVQAGETETAASEEGQGRKGLAGRLGNFLLRMCCILPPRETCCMRSTRVVPVQEDS
ncbi:serine/threonine-protein kinase MARK2-like [Lemur catta]|uniref:serine/threonine-protein kinase MARK2-like n=1 Tax=Lemur catta TaxID=9447 RepID=UPI001E268066|nr:serine/threonine-protein kinase MARK2-like [Lemur catta]